MSESHAVDRNNESPIEVKLDGAIATVTLNRPARANALDLRAWQALGQTAKALSRDNDLRCVVLRGAGEKAFAAGGDIIEFQTERANAQQALNYGDVVADALNAVFAIQHPTIAMIYGACTGGGLEVACACDMRISATSGRFGVPINRLGHGFAYPEALMVMRVVPRPVLLELLYEGRIMDADEAYQRGLVNRVVPDVELANHIVETANHIARGAPLGARMSKQITAHLLDSAQFERADIERGYTTCDSADYREGLAAFAEKRDPKFTGH